MSASPINLLDKFSKLSQQWSPKVIAEMNDYQFKLAKIENEFTWHSHANTDEVFLVIKGEMSIELRGVINTGENSSVLTAENDVWI
ncbi:cupin [Pseudoalteromonas sp. FUC4]|uniref:cupin domain-containing protein n=1 Tax=Pseudoalteromonas sp. FUC4 TaxID=2511201 RepID=UPI0011F2DD33|nr:cupin domain-containing protein [Pseudoalteromonas sp. FUC4]KAA1155396.1 cupin [Pseudoalteromonas sp. FUC4]